MGKVVSHVDKVRRLVDAAWEKGATSAAEFIKDKADETIPIDTGDMRRSGAAVFEDGVAVVGYDTHYTVLQHENLQFGHQPGKRAKWLERGIAENLDGIEARVAVGMLWL